MARSGSTVHARIASVDAASPASRAGIKAGECVCSVDGDLVRDILDWQWLTACDECEVKIEDEHGGVRTVLLERASDESWGIAFDDAVFDGIKSCCNTCTFCFMRQLPKGLRKTLYVRDDDFRLSFLQGNFVTLTNLGEEEMARIIEQRISPLRVSLHAHDARVRNELMGHRAEVGLRNMEVLLAADIQMDVQIVLVPDVNDGSVLDDTLIWAYRQENIMAVGIVPLGFTRHQVAFSSSFDDPQRARTVLDQIQPFQQRAMHERGGAWVYAADEFYLNAYGEDVLEHIPPADFYGAYPLFEDGIGIVRSSVDDFLDARTAGLDVQVNDALEVADMRMVIVFGTATLSYVRRLFAQSALSDRVRPLFVRNRFFGGNVNVTGLLVGEDMADAICQDASEFGNALYLLPSVAFNADGLTLDGLSAEDIRAQCGQEVQVVPSNPLDCMHAMIRSAKEA